METSVLVDWKKAGTRYVCNLGLLEIVCLYAYATFEENCISSKVFLSQVEEMQMSALCRLAPKQDGPNQPTNFYVGTQQRNL